MQSTTTAGGTESGSAVERAAWAMDLAVYELAAAEERGDLGHARRLRETAYAAERAYHEAVFAAEEVAS